MVSISWDCGSHGERPEIRHEGFKLGGQEMANLRAVGWQNTTYLKKEDSAGLISKAVKLNNNLPHN